ncbi:MAG: hypothetical protein HFF73_04445 [Oscillospiraceae bacterium]|nr:hypothetical protein [Oscillospiraceae bacterium]
MAKKILVGLSLAVIVMLAVPLGLMAASVVRGESPKQLAEKEQLGELDPGSEDDTQAEDVLKPVVQPDPGPMPPPPVLAEAEPAEEAAEPEPAPASGTGKKPVKKAAPKAAQKTAPKATLPKAVLGPNEAPCMVDGLDGYAYDY